MSGGPNVLFSDHQWLALYGRLLRFARIRLRAELRESAMEAEDLVSGVIADLLSGRVSARDRNRVEAFLEGVIRNRVQHVIRGSSRMGQLPPSIPATTESPERFAERSEAMDQVRAAIRQLPPQMQRVVELCVIEQIPLSDVAQQLGIGKETVRTHLHRGRTRLREILAPRPSQTDLADDHSDAVPDPE